MLRAVVSASALALALVVPRSVAVAQAPGAASPARASSSAEPQKPVASAPAVCASQNMANRLDQPLRHVAQRIAAGQPITIVAIGSSSTAGAGASSSAASYPSRLELELRARLPHVAIRVLNRGVSGEEAAEMLARFDKAVLNEQPDLVVWQVGTNSVLRHHRLTPVVTIIHEGLARLKESGADVILMDPQFAPKVISEPDAERMVGMIATAAKAENVGIFHRFDVMRYWHETKQMAFESFVSPDGLHMNDWSYACVAKLLAAAIGDAATRATAVAGAHPRL